MCRNSERINAEEIEEVFNLFQLLGFFFFNENLFYTNNLQVEPHPHV
jgi:hypothetical protein